MKKEEEKRQQWQQGKRGSGTQNFTQKLNRDILFLHCTFISLYFKDYISPCFSVQSSDSLTELEHSTKPKHIPPLPQLSSLFNPSPSQWTLK